jgi:hypothetical protein
MDLLALLLAVAHFQQPSPSPGPADRIEKATRTLTLGPGVKLLDIITSADPDHFGCGFEPLGDVDSDDVPDFAIGALCGVFGLTSSTRYVKVYSGKERREMYTLRGEELADTTDQFGYGMQALADADEDGKSELLIFGTEGLFKGNAKVFSGKDGTMLRLFGSSTFPGRYGDWADFNNGACLLGDLDGDSVKDFALLDYRDEYRSRIVSGRTLEAGDLVSGLVLPHPIDRDGDGRPDLVFWVRSSERASERDHLCWLSSRGGERIPMEDNGMTDGRTRAGSTIVDWNNDGQGDYCIAFYPPGRVCDRIPPSEPYYDIEVYSGKDFRLIHSWQVLLESGGEIAALDNVGDIDGDGRAEILLTTRLGWYSHVKILSTVDGKERYWIEAPNNDSFGSSACRVGDLDGDGQPEVLIGDFEAAWAGRCMGCAYVFSFPKQ